MSTRLNSSFSIITLPQPRFAIRRRISYPSRGMASKAVPSICDFSICNSARVKKIVSLLLLTTLTSNCGYCGGRLNSRLERRRIGPPARISSRYGDLGVMWMSGPERVAVYDASKRPRGGSSKTEKSAVIPVG